AIGEDSSKQILKRVNDYLSENMPPGMFITIMLLLYDAEESRVNFVSAGHNPMLFFNAAKSSLQKINPQGMPLGMPVTLNGDFADSLEEVDLHIADQDLLFMFTDGVSESVSPSGKRYGLDKLADFVAAGLAQPGRMNVSQLAASLTDELDAYSGYAPPSDDISFIVARKTGADRADHRGDSAVDSHHIDDEKSR
ncbi:MAG: PP2C family protein-serine/threonine phosphatase, partial [bacterium]|nr:PP2C family protein-serine/threonine phosphatase [bacterium]